MILHKHIPGAAMRWFAAICFAGFGFFGLHEALDHLLPPGTGLHHIILIACIPVVAFGMWYLDRREKAKAAAEGKGE